MGRPVNPGFKNRDLVHPVRSACSRTYGGIGDAPAPSSEEDYMNKSETNAPVMNDVLQSDHHVHMSEEEIAKAKAHHAKKHGADNPQATSAKPAQGKKIPVKPR
jgi:hypothetical protein